MAMESERSSSSSKPPLHNFALPDGLRWGNQKFLRCMKVNSNGKISAVVRRPSSAASASFPTRGSNNADRFVRSSLGKRKEREEFIDRPSSPAVADDRRGSDFRKFGYNLKVRPDSSNHYSESNRKLKSMKSCDGERGAAGAGGGSREGDGIAAVREKLMFDLQTETDKMKDAMLRDGLDTPDQVDDNNHTSPPVPSVSPANNASPPSNAIPPWNLRTRRAAACKSPQPPNVAGTSSVAGGDMSVMTAAGQGLNSNVIVSDPKSPPEENKAPRGGATTSIETKERAKFSVPLSKREIEEDFLAFAGRRPPRRPHKRPRYVQKVMDTLFPGLWLTEITSDMYKVVEIP